MPILRRTITQRVIRNARQRGIKVYSRWQWRSKRGLVYAARRRKTLSGGFNVGPYKFVRKADTVVQHITVTRPSGDLKADARDVEQIGYERFGSGVSYNWLVDMTTGHVAAGQPLDAKGTHTINDKGIAGFSPDQNLAARAIAVVGMPETKLSAKAEAAIERLLLAMVDEGAITPGFDYRPHSFFAAKDCPCDPTRDRMGVIRQRVRNERAVS